MSNQTKTITQEKDLIDLAKWYLNEALIQGLVPELKYYSKAGTTFETKEKDNILAIYKIIKDLGYRTSEIRYKERGPCGHNQLCYIITDYPFEKLVVSKAKLLGLKMK